MPKIRYLYDARDNTDSTPMTVETLISILSKHKNKNVPVELYDETLPIGRICYIWIDLDTGAVCIS